MEYIFKMIAKTPSLNARHSIPLLIHCQSRQALSKLHLLCRLHTGLAWPFIPSHPAVRQMDRTVRLNKLETGAHSELLQFAREPRQEETKSLAIVDPLKNFDLLGFSNPQRPAQESRSRSRKSKAALFVTGIPAAGRHSFIGPSLCHKQRRALE